MSKVRLFVGLLIVSLGIYLVWSDLQKKEVPKQPLQMSESVPTPNELKLKYQREDCLKNNERDLVLVDIDQEKTYVFAVASQYFNGPYPIDEKDLIQIPAVAVDSRSDYSLQDCTSLEEKMVK